MMFGCLCLLMQWYAMLCLLLYTYEFISLQNIVLAHRKLYLLYTIKTIFGYSDEIKVAVDFLYYSCMDI